MNGLCAKQNIGKAGLTTRPFGMEGKVMRLHTARFIGLILAAISLTSCCTPRISESLVRKAFSGRQGAFVLIECSSGAVTTFHPRMAEKPLPPCSTFKVWNALIGLESGIISSPDEAFYQWDGVKRAFPAWNRDLTVKQAFQASCVPAFQNLARRIGPVRMQTWIDRIGYGDQDISAGIDVFWLPAKDRRTILISPAQQAELMRKLVTGQLPFSRASLSVLRKIMRTRKTDRGILYGKTGSGANNTGTFVLGWFVGYVTSNGRTYAFACTVQGENAMGKDARTVVETILEKQRLL